MDILRRFSALIAAGSCAALAWVIHSNFTAMASNCRPGTICQADWLESLPSAQWAWGAGVTSTSVLAITTMWLVAVNRLSTTRLLWAIASLAIVLGASRAVPGLGFSPNLQTDPAGMIIMSETDALLWDGIGNRVIIGVLVLLAIRLVFDAARRAAPEFTAHEITLTAQQQHYI